MNIIEVAYKWNGGFSKRRCTDYIALHHAEAQSCTAADLHSWHLDKGWSGIGYHFFVRKDGSIYRGRPLDVMGAHVEGMNNCSIGICAEGAYQSKDKTMPQTQYNAIVELCIYLKQNYYPNAKIVGHREIGDSDCPGQYYPLEQIKRDITNGGINNEEEIDMEELNALKERISVLEIKENKMIYNYIDENMPSWAVPTIEKLYNRGLLVGNENGELGLTDELLKILVINDRAGLYD